jgi:hypothetical protein
LSGGLSFQNTFTNSIETFCFHSLALAHVTDKNAVTKTLKSPKSVRLDGIPGFVTNGCVDTYVPLVQHIRLSQKMFLSL